MQLTADWFVGIDWASQTHEICVLDHEGRVCRAAAGASHAAPALQALMEALLERAQGRPASVAIGIEVPRGAVGRAAASSGGLRSTPSTRSRWTGFATGSRSRARRTIDRDALGDRRCVAHRPAGVSTGAAGCAADRAIARVVAGGRGPRRRTGVAVDQSTARFGVSHRAQTCSTLCPAADEPWFWALLRAAPAPDDHRRLSLRRLDRLLRGHRIRRLEAAQVRAVLQEPSVYSAPGVVEAVAAHIAAGAAASRIAWRRSAATRSGIWQVCWTRSKRRNRRRGTSASMLTSPSSAPCQGSGHGSPPGCSLKPRSRWSIEPITCCAPGWELRRSRNRADGGVWS